MTISTGSTTNEVEKTDLVNVTIDGIQVAVPKDTLVIRAAEQIGVQVPRFCDHPLLAPVGACRQCLVDVPDAGNGRGFPKPQASCTLPVAEGMVVNTQATSQVADKAQQGVMEFLLINHPLDCPVCDKGGECPLQNQAMSNGRGESRFSGDDAPTPGALGKKRTFPKPINLSPNVLLDRERCIVCQRCTRFANEIAGDPFIALVERGAQQQIGIAEDAPFLSYFSGNVIQICPVGALTSEEYRFRSRPFDLVSAPGVAEHDACGSAIRVDHRRGQVMRRLAGNDPEVNEEWLTDKDRYAFTYSQGDDRLAYPQVRDEEGNLRPASWPEAFAVAARGLADLLVEEAVHGRHETTDAEGSRDGADAPPRPPATGVGVLTGGRLTAEDAYAYSKFARVALGSNDIDFRARPHSDEEAAFLAGIAGSGLGVTYADLESASKVVLVGLEPEDEAGAIWLRLHKSVRAGGTEVVAIAPFSTRGLRKLSGRLVPTAPGDEAAALTALAGELDASTVVLVGDRFTAGAGVLSAVAAVDAAGARLAWVPRRAGDRGAVEAGCLPGLLPGGRLVDNAAARVDVAAAWGVDTLTDKPGRSSDRILSDLCHDNLGGLLVAGVELDDLPDPALAREALAKARFVVALDIRETEVTRLADVVLPVAPTSEKAGTFVSWEGRARSFPAALSKPGALPDLRSLAGIASEMGRPLGFTTVEGARAEMDQLGAWDGSRDGRFATSSTNDENAASSRGGSLTTGTVDRGGRASDRHEIKLATWKQHIDNGRMQDGDKYLAATARPAVAKVSQATYDAHGPTVTLTGDRGSVTLPAEVADDIVDGVVWVPANSFGNGVLADLASPGSNVTIGGIA